MANVNAPNGFTPRRHLTGGTIRPSDRYRIASALAADIGLGDPVVETGTSDAAGNPQITIANANGPVTGIFGGCYYKDASTGDVKFSKEWVSGQATYNSEPAVALVFDDRNIVFEAQMSLALAAANIGLFANLVIGSPSALGVSTSAVNSSGLASTEDVVKILAVAQKPKNELGNYARVEVIINDHATRVEV